MKKFTKVQSHVTPLALKDIDTDMIIPADHLKGTGVGGYGEHVFSRLKASDPSFPFNDSRFDNSEIILTESNFGCGSSREHAVWALMEAGVKVIIAPSFSDIFFNNSAKNGLLLVTLPDDDIKKLFELSDIDLVHLAVDLEAQLVSHEALDDMPFTYDSFARHCLINGMDQLDYLRAHMDKIDTYDQARQTHNFIEA